MKLLVIGSGDSIFTYEFITEIAMKLPDTTVDFMATPPKDTIGKERLEALKNNGVKVFTPKPVKVRFKRLPHITVYLRNTLRYLRCRKYDVINIHFIASNAFAAALFAKKKSRIVASVYGSDVMRASAKERKLQKVLFKRADCITVANNSVKEKFTELYSDAFENKIKFAQYGSKSAEEMKNYFAVADKNKCKEEFGIPKDKLCILCGYNGSKAHRHIDIIKRVSSMAFEQKEKLFLLCHCSYGATESYNKEIEEALEKSGVDGKVVTDFMTGEKLARFRACVDIMFNIQPTDAMSASMLEQVEAGSIVVNGSWLNYEAFENLFMLKLNSLDDIPDTLVRVVENYDELKNKAQNNKGVIDVLFWEKKIPQWKDILLDL